MINNNNVIKAEKLIKDFSIFVADANNTRYFAAKAAIIHLEKLKTLLDTNIENFNEQIQHLKTYL